MTDGEKTILAEIRSLRSEMNSGFTQARSDVNRAHKRIDNAEDKIAANDKAIAVAKTKTGIFATIITFIFTTIGTAIASWFNHKPH